MQNKKQNDKFFEFESNLKTYNTIYHLITTIFTNYYCLFMTIIPLFENRFDVNKLYTIDYKTKILKVKQLVLLFNY